MQIIDAFKETSCPLVAPKRCRHLRSEVRERAVPQLKELVPLHGVVGPCLWAAEANGIMHDVLENKQKDYAVNNVLKERLQLLEENKGWSTYKFSQQISILELPHRCLQSVNGDYIRVSHVGYSSISVPSGTEGIQCFTVGVSVRTVVKPSVDERRSSLLTVPQIYIEWSLCLHVVLQVFRGFICHWEATWGDFFLAPILPKVITFILSFVQQPFWGFFNKTRN